MTKCAFIPNFLKLYNILWQPVLPFLRRNPQLAATFDKSTAPVHLDPADVWIQGASAGEAYLAVSIIRAFAPQKPTTILLTATTDHGMQILKNGLEQIPCHPNVRLNFDVFPFDMPSAMDLAVSRVNPTVMVLLETELWPAHLHALKQKQIPILVINGRMSKKSGRHYRLTRKFWQCFAPDRIMAISEEDAQRFSCVFLHTRIQTMNNIKFDRMNGQEKSGKPSALADLLPPGLPLSILASFHRREEAQIVHMVKMLKTTHPNQVIALFPRHMDRVAPVIEKLGKKGFTVLKGSEISTPLTGPAIVMWDRFGELCQAYEYADVVFVGGSLVPLGGQNFMEPAALGVPTIIGPFWQNFAWVGEDIFSTNAVTRCDTWQQAAQTMCGHLADPRGRQANLEAVSQYILEKQGGSQTAVNAIQEALMVKRHTDAKKCHHSE